MTAATTPSSSMSSSRGPNEGSTSAAKAVADTGLSIAAASEGAPDLRVEQSVSLDTMLVRAALGSGLHRSLPVKELAGWGGRLARRPARTASRFTDLAREAGRIGLGTGSPPPRDRRFADRAWQENGAYRRWVQLHFAAQETAHLLLRDAEFGDRAESKLRLLVDNIASALAPSNTPINPVALKEAIDSGGASFVRGLRNFITDMSSAPRIPNMVDQSAFELGENIATTAGNVIHRTPVFELIEYAGVTEKVREIPVLLVPPTINKFYALDLAPDRSVVEYLVGQGFRVFALSWRNPTARHASWGLDAYVHAVIGALEVTRTITGSLSTSLWGTCSGGIITSVAVALLAATGRQDQVASLALPVTLLDQQVSGTSGAIMDPGLAGLAVARSARQGYLDGAALAELFAWLRPDDLIWNYWVSNYLLGKQPPAFDLLYWNADSTRMPAALHRDFVELALHNQLVEPGSLVSHGVPIDLSEVTVDAFVIGAVADHITPWQSCYRTTQMLGGKCEFVLSNSGHVAAMVNPPGNPKASYQHSSHTPADPEEFRADAERHQGSWWPAYTAWLDARSGEKCRVPGSVEALN